MKNVSDLKFIKATNGGTMSTIMVLCLVFQG